MAAMHDFLLGAAFVAMVLAPCIFSGSRREPANMREYPDYTEHTP
jgi:hypothetical protein